MMEGRDVERECPFPGSASELDVLFFISPDELFNKRSLENVARKVFGRVDVICPKSLEHLKEIAGRSAGRYHAILVGGGDGTLNRVVNSIDLERIGVMVVPLGSGNDFARNFRFGRSRAKLFSSFTNATWQRVDLLKAGKILFHNSGGIGLDAETLRTRERSRGRFLRNYNVAFLRTLPGLKAPRFKVTLDGGDYSGDYLWIVVMNSPWIGGGMLVCPDARFDDGVLDVVLLRDMPKMKLALLLPLIYSGRHTNHSGVACLKGRQLDVECEGGIERIALDGELYRVSGSEVKFTVIEKALWVFGTPARGRGVE